MQQLSMQTKNAFKKQGWQQQVTIIFHKKDQLAGLNQQVTFEVKAEDGAGSGLSGILGLKFSQGTSDYFLPEGRYQFNMRALSGCKYKNGQNISLEWLSKIAPGNFFHQFKMSRKNSEHIRALLEAEA